MHFSPIPYSFFSLSRFCFVFSLIVSGWCKMVYFLYATHKPRVTACFYPLRASTSVPCSHCGPSTRLFHSIYFILLKFSSRCLFTLPLLVDADVPANSITIEAFLADSSVKLIFQVEQRTKHTFVGWLKITTIRSRNHFDSISKHMLQFSHSLSSRLLPCNFVSKQSTRHKHFQLWAVIQRIQFDLDIFSPNFLQLWAVLMCIWRFMLYNPFPLLLSPFNKNCTIM